MRYPVKIVRTLSSLPTNFGGGFSNYRYVALDRSLEIIQMEIDEDDSNSSTVPVNVQAVRKSKSKNSTSFPIQTRSRRRRRRNGRKHRHTAMKDNGVHNDKDTSNSSSTVPMDFQAVHESKSKNIKTITPNSLPSRRVRRRTRRRRL